MDIARIKELMESAIRDRGCFLVDLSVSADNDVTLTVESAEGTVVMEDCIALDKAFHELFNQDEEDYSLTVTSAGLDRPFMVLRQYLKAVGSSVTVSLRGGKRLTGILTAASEEEITLRHSVKEEVPGKKKKVSVEKEETFPFSEINSVSPYITFD